MAKRDSSRRMHLEIAVSGNGVVGEASYDCKDFTVVTLIADGGTFNSRASARVQGATTWENLGASAVANGTYESNVDISGYDEIRFTVDTHSVDGVLRVSAF